MNALLCLAALTGAADDQPAKKEPLELTIKFDKATYKPGDKVSMMLGLKNVSDEELWIGEGWLAPESNEIGPARHFELEIRNEDETRFHFWGPVLTEGSASGIRKVFLLKPGETFKGGCVISDGSLATIKTDKRHKLGVDSRNYTVRLVYQVNPKTHGVYQPPDNFDPKKLWIGKIASNAVDLKFE